MSNISRIETSRCLECGSDTARMGGGFVNRVPAYGAVVEGYYCGGCQSTDEFRELWVNAFVCEFSYYLCVARGENLLWESDDFGAELDEPDKRAIQASLNDWIDEGNDLEDYPNMDVEWDFEGQDRMLAELAEQAELDWPYAKEFREIYGAFRDVEDRTGAQCVYSDELVRLAQFIEANNLGTVTY